MAIGPAVIGAGALLAWALGQKKTTTFVPPQNRPPSGMDPANPSTGVNNTGTDIAKGAVSVIGTAAGIIVPAVVGHGGTAAAAAGEATAAGAKAAGVAAGEATTAGIDVVEVLGGSVFIIGVMIAVVVAQINDAIIAAARPAQDLISKALGESPAKSIFDAFMNRFLAAVPSATRQSYTMPVQLMRKVARTALYLTYVKGEAYNKGLLNFYRWFGWTPDSTGAIRPSGNLYSNYGSNLWAYTDYEGHVFSQSNSPGVLQHTMEQITWQVDSYSVDKNYLNAPPGSLAEIRADAVEMLGSKFWSVYNSMAFLGGVAAAAVMATAGWFAAGTWPGDQVFAQTIAARLGWQAAQATFWVTNQSPAVTFTDWWLVDPASGLRVSPGAMRNPGSIYISVPGTQVSPGQFSGARFGRVGFGAASTSSQCVLPSTGEFIYCGDPRYVVEMAQRAAALAAAKASARPHTTTVGRSGSGLALPLAVAALLLLKSGALHAVGFGDMPRRRRRRRR